MHDRLQKRTGRQHDCRRQVLGVATNAHTQDPSRFTILLRQQVFDEFLPQFEIWLAFDLRS